MFQTIFRALFDPAPKSTTRDMLRTRLRLEALESRVTPVTKTVLNPSGDPNVQDSLPWCVTFINTGGDLNNTIDFQAGANWFIPLKVPLVLGRNTVVDATAATSITVAAENGLNLRIFEIGVGQTCELEDLTIKNGKAGVGAGIYNHGTKLTVINCIVEFNEASQEGGGIYNATGASLELDTTIIRDNKSTSHGGGLYNNGSVTATPATGTIRFKNNRAQGGPMMPVNFGGGIYNAADGTIDFGQIDVQIELNTAKDGAGVYNDSTSNNAFTMVVGAIKNNTASRDGGGIYSKRGTLIFTSITIDLNSAGTSGGGYYVDGGSVTFTTCSFSGNTKGAAGIGAGGASRVNTVTWAGQRGGTQPAGDFVTFGGG